MSDNLPTTQDMGELLFYQTEDGDTRVQVRFQDDSVWLSQTQMTELFSKDKRTISEHIQNVFDEGELREDATVRKFRTVQIEGSREVTREISYYNLDVIISVGYRVKSHRGTQFRIWATQRLREYLIKGFAMDDARLKEAGGGDYFEELLARIRDIRSSEKVFWRKVLDIYATSIDYDPNVDTSQRFFKIVQNKMHWAAHGRTAAEVIKARADASKPQMGLTSLSGKGLTRTDAQVAKNYLNVEELDTLNRIVAVYLEFAELQAKSRRTMTMQDWISKLDDFLRISDRETLTHAGSVTHEAALAHANAEYDKYKQRLINEKSAVEKHFEQSLKQLESAEAKVAKAAPRKKKGGDA
ncbi:MAG: virulence RhuM family protein [Alphaproteobacteria bacterium]|jgi:hypothetical protein